MNENGSESASNGARTLHQRIAAIAGEAQVKVSGRTAPTAGARPALSIADVDRVLGDLMAQHGVTSDFEMVDEPTDRIEVTANDKTLQTFRVHLKVYVTNADDPHEYLERQVWDDGSNISGAVSFALKRYLRALFHLAEDDDTQQAQQRQAQRAEWAPPPRWRGTTASQPPDDDGDVGQVQRARIALGVAPREERYSAAEIADRGPLYDSAKALGKDDAWVDTLLDTPQPDGRTISKASLRKKLDIELAKRAGQKAEPARPSEPQDGGKEAEAGKDPKALVCPFCGSADAPGDIPGEPGRMRCWGGKGGCAKSYPAERRLSREEFEAMKASGSLDSWNAGWDEPSPLEQKVDEAGVRPAGVS